MLRAARFTAYARRRVQFTRLIYCKVVHGSGEVDTETYPNLIEVFFGAELNAGEFPARVAWLLVPVVSDLAGTDSDAPGKRNEPAKSDANTELMRTSL
jgi:hypothetical protein